jgi:hypothetical protein
MTFWSQSMTDPVTTPLRSDSRNAARVLADPAEPDHAEGGPGEVTDRDRAAVGPSAGPQYLKRVARIRQLQQNLSRQKDFNHSAKMR